MYQSKIAIKILLTGNPGIGKTTILSNLVQRLLTNGQTILGCLVKEERIQERRERFHIHYLPDNTHTILASSLEQLSDSFVSRFSVNTHALHNELYPFMEQMAQASPDTLLVFDEIGRMQKGGLSQNNTSALADTFLKRVDQLFASPHNMIATILYDDEEWTHTYKNSPNVKVISVTQDNRDFIVSEVMDLLEQHISR